MRWLFVSMLFANALFFAWTFAGSVNRDDINSEFSISNADKSKELKLLRELQQLPPSRGTENWVPPHQEWGGEQQDSEAEEDGNKGQIHGGSAPEYEQDATILIEQDWLAEDTTCYSIGPMFSEQEADAVKKSIAEHGLSHNSKAEQEADTYYGVYLRAEKTVVALAELIERMNAKGIENYRLVSAGELRNNLLLGVYTTREEVDARLAELKQKGFEPIVVPKHSDSAVWINMLVEPEQQEEDFVKTLLQRDDRFVVECSEVGLG